MRISLTIIILFFNLSVQGQSVFDNYAYLNSRNKKIETIDRNVRGCLILRNAETTLGMVECFRDGSVQMDSLLNVIYKKLMSRLKEDDKVALKNSQRVWLKFYEQENQFTGEVFRSWSNYSKYNYGQQINVTQMVMTYTLVRERVNRLSYYLIAE